MYVRLSPKQIDERTTRIPPGIGFDGGNLTVLDHIVKETMVIEGRISIVVEDNRFFIFIGGEFESVWERAKNPPYGWLWLMYLREEVAGTEPPPPATWVRVTKGITAAVLILLFVCLCFLFPGFLLLAYHLPKTLCNWAQGRNGYLYARDIPACPPLECVSRSGNPTRRKPRRKYGT